MAETLIASTKYNDRQGTIALDDAHTDIERYFAKDLNGEHILGFKADFNTEFTEITVDLTIYTGSLERDNNGNRVDRKYPEVKAYKKEISVEEFSRLFKRLQIKTFDNLGSSKTKIKIIEEINI